MKVLSNCLGPHGLYSPWNSPSQNSGIGSLSLLQGIFPTQGLNPDLPTLQANYLPAEPQVKPKNTEVGSLSLLQQIFLTQELNQDLLCWLPWWLRGESVCLQCGRPGFDPWVGKISLEKEMATHSSILAWRFP